MRDRDYEMTAPPGVYRIALLGPSTAMGAAVRADQSFESLLEDRLNRDTPSGAGAYEILNFGVAGYSPLHVLFQLERKVLAFRPDMVLFVGHESDLARTSRWWSHMVQNGVLPGNPFNDDLLRRSGMTPGAGPNESRRRLRPYESELLGWVYGRLVAECRQQGITPVFAYMEKVTDPDEPEGARRRQQILSLAAQAGFTVFDPSVVFHHRGGDRLWISANDNHPNPQGSRLLADELYVELTAQRGALGLGQPKK
jgi:lysophospholipase L1-like esterase